MSNFDKKWTEQELEVLYTERLKGVPYSVIASTLDRTPDSLRKKYNRCTDWSVYSFYDEDAKEQKKLEIEDAAIKRTESINKSLDKYRLRADIIGDKLEQAARKLPLAPPPCYVPSNKANRTSEDMGLIFSDLHVGHEHTMEETGNISEYNIDIFHKRLENLKKAITDIKELHSKLYKIPKLHIFALGDMVEGANTAGAWSQVWIDTPIYDQVMIGYRAISDFIYYMLTLFDEVEFYGIYGNHGRIAPSGAEKKYNNFDLFCYKYIELEFKNNPRIKFNIEKTWWMMTTVQNHNFLLLHGDDIKAKNPPVTTFLDLERKMTGMIKQIPNYTLCGHFHNCSEYTTHNGRVLMNGSFVGSDVYSISNYMPGNVPEQKIFGIHPKIGITWTYNINLNHERA